MRTLPDLVVAWAACVTEKERAGVEREMRGHTTFRGYSGHTWIVAQLPRGNDAAGPRHVMDRDILMNVGPAAEPIWDALAAKKITLRNCGIIIARSRDDGQSPTIDKVEATVQQFLAGTLDAKRPSAQNVKTTSGRRSKHAVEAQAVTKERNSEFYAAVEKLFDQMLVGVPEFAALTIRNAGKADLRALTATWQSTISRARAASPDKLSEITKTKRLNAALRVLNVDPPPNGEFTPKVLTKIRTQFRRLTRLYHPDRTNNNPDMEEEYRNIVEANSCIQTLLSSPSPDSP